MKIHTQAIHSGDRKPPNPAVPVTTPIVPAASYVYEDIETTDRVFGEEIAGYAYARYGSPTTAALEELLTTLENGAGALATSSGMTAMQFAIQTALTDRRRSIVASGALYGASIRMLNAVFEPAGVDVRWVDITDLDAVGAAIAESKPGCVLTETISNPLLRVAALDQIGEICRDAEAVLVVDNTFATPLMTRPIEHGAGLVVHSLTKYLSGHGDVLGGAVIATEQHLPVMRALTKICGPNLGAFEAYLSMRGIKTFPLRMEKQCANAACVAEFLSHHPGVDRVYHLSDPNHPDAGTIERLLHLRGAVVTFELKDGGRDEVFTFLNRLKLVVKATSVGDVHTMALYPAMSSHRELAPKHRQRLGIGDGLVRLSVGIEAAEDILADLRQALG